MLASTVQFSTYDQPPLPRPRQTPPLPQEAWTVRKPERPCQKDHGRPLPQDPTACLRPPDHPPPRSTPPPGPRTDRRRAVLGAGGRRRPNWSAFHPRAPPRTLRGTSGTGGAVTARARLCTTRTQALAASAP